MSNKEILEIIGIFILIYPLGMSIVWSIGTLLHFYEHEREIKYTNNELPFCSILIPACNEVKNIHNVIDQMHKLNYPDYEIIVINDGSTDGTVKVIESILCDYPKLRFVNSTKNNGKAHALYLGLLASKGDYVVGVDADSYLESDALIHLIAPMLAENNGLNVGAVTGNPRVRNRTNLLAKLQTAEYSSVVGMIKRTQQLSSSCMTISGVCVAFRKQALIDCGLWDKDMITEDIAVTWKLHEHKWRIIYNPFAICWMLVPTKVGGLFKQRVRWAQGGIEVLFRHLFRTVKRMDLRNLLLLGEQIVGIVWAFLYVISIPFVAISILNGDATYITYQLKVLLCVSIINFLIAFFIGKRYDKQLVRIYPWVIWYPLIYWFFNVIVLIVGFFKVIANKISGKKVKRATWKSPDRGEAVSNGIHEERSIVDIRASKFDMLVVFPLTILIWSYILYSLWNLLTNVLSSIIISSESILYAVVDSTSINYFVFIYVVVIIGIVGAYLYYLSVPFPTLEKHLKTEDNDKSLENLFDIEDIRLYQNRKMLTFEEVDETSRDEYSFI